MTKQAFQQRYHAYMTNDGREAQAEADRVNDEGIPGDEAIAVNFGHTWGLMLKSAHAYLTDELGMDLSGET